MCGEQALPEGQRNDGLGSPPRVRGTAVSRQRARVFCRITPACAGNRPIAWYYLAQFQDHPRVCGEQLPLMPNSSAISGSPPRVRGTGGDGHHPDHPAGITPACAGNRRMTRTHGRGAGDHPRVCGEQQGSRAPPPVSAGSPPRVRGTAGAQIGLTEADRITPACAGNRSSTDGRGHNSARHVRRPRQPLRRYPPLVPWPDV